MSRRFTYSRTIHSVNRGDETFTAVEFDSFDEAKKAVEKGIYEHQLELDRQSAPAVKLSDPAEVDVPRDVDKGIPSSGPTSRPIPNKR